ncbi:hypothetical protein FIBSPDRAFT_898746 [Athelia psychrophila]|uniref:F-box domain-containing protein n=1 Tax=Athelia psychrophila TaxID=1759441 RepID=A0A166AM10_9AGAM|nr:hypothetical protein FIBSPDRAFT_898746 [Fibularhizoctonia sp. CBS 109695]
MHRCLQVEELVSLICEEVYHDNNKKDESKSIVHLRNLALTARTFLEPALNILWRSLHSLDHLFMVLPRDTWKETEPMPISRLDDDDGRIRLALRTHRYLKREDLDRYRFYKQKIKELVLSDEAVCVKVANETCWTALRHAFQMFYPSESYLPRPCILDYGAYFDDEEAWRRYDLVSKNLKSLKIQDRHPADVNGPILMMISTLSSRAPMLEDLNVLGITNKHLRTELLPSLVGQKNLRSFTCNNPITSEFATTLGSLPHLKKLSCRLPGASFSLSLPRHPGQRPFPSLHSISLGTRRLASITHFLDKTMIAGPIRTFRASITWSQEAWRDDPLHTLEILAGVSASSLTSFTLWSARSYDDVLEGVAPTLSLREIRPLLACTRLKKLHIEFDRSLDGFDNAAIQVMAAAWPRLRNIILIPFPPEQPSLCTIHCLIDLARGCRDLEGVGITFSSSPEPYDIQGAARSLTHYSLEEMHVGYSLLDKSSVPGIAAFLAELFPNLDHISTLPKNYMRSYEEYNENTAAWKEVLRLHGGLLRGG